MVGFAQNIEDAREAHRRSAIRLTPKEFELLTVLAAHVGRVITHRSILKAIWGVNGWAAGASPRARRPAATDFPTTLLPDVARLRDDNPTVASRSIW
jgi:hypothetical protein